MAKKKGRKRRARRGSNLTIADLRALLDQKVVELNERRDALLEELAAVDAALEAAGAGRMPVPGAAPRRGRPPGSGKKIRRTGSKPGRGRRPAGTSLQAMIRNALKSKGGPMRIGDIASAVLKAGYQSSSSRFATIVTQRLADMGDVKRVDRGVYQIK